MKDIARLIHEPGATVAIVGATDNPGKYGSVIYRDLKRKGFRVFGVNPHRPTIDGDRAYPDLSALPEAPTVVNFVVPPESTLTVLKEADQLGYKNVWVQPGAESPAAIARAKELGMSVIAGGPCLLVALNFRDE